MGDSKAKVTIRHRALGIQPPLYIAGSFSNPQWVPQLMEFTTGDDGVYTFTKTFQVEPLTKYQYKFRVGEGDWWILDEEAPTVTDESGNRNNILEAPEVVDAQEAPTEATPAPEALSSVELNVSENSFPEPDEPSPEQPASASIHENADIGIEQPQLETESSALLAHADIEREETHTPDFVKTTIEVADSAAILDRPTPEPDHPSEAVGEDEVEVEVAADQPPQPWGASAADTAAEVADTAATLDEDEDVQPEAEPSSVEPVQEVSITTTEVADNTQALERAESASDPEAESASTAPTEDTADVGTEVSVTAALLDANEPAEHIEELPLASGSLAGVKFDMKDDGLDIAGYTDGPEPVPLFAHECAGLYEDDEVPAVSHAQADIRANDPATEHDSQDFDDPTLEQFPSTKDEIISTVRRVSTSLNADQTSVEGISPSPVVEAQSEAAGDAVSDLAERDVSSTSDHGQDDSLSLARSHSQKSLSEHPLSLHSIAEGAEEEEAQRTADKGIPTVLETDETDQIAAASTTKPESESTDESAPSQMAPAAEQAQTADEVIEAAQEAEGGHTADVTLMDDEPPAMIQKDSPTIEDAAFETHEAAPAIPVASTTEELPAMEEAPVSIEDMVEEVLVGKDAPLAEDISAIVEAPVSIEDVVEKEPVESLPMEETPAPVEETTPAPAIMEVSAVEEALVEAAPPIKETPVEETLVEEAPVEEALVEEAPVEEAAVEENSVEEALVEEDSVEEAPVEEAPVDKAPVDEAPVDEAPVDEAPVDEAPVDEGPVEEAPIKEAAVEEAPALFIQEDPAVDEVGPAVEKSPVVEDALVFEAAAHTEEVSAGEGAAPIKNATSIEEIASIEETPAVEDVSAVEGAAPLEEARAAQEAWADEEAPAVEELPVVKELPNVVEAPTAEEAAPIEEAAPEEEAPAVTEVALVEDDAPLQEATAPKMASEDVENGSTAESAPAVESTGSLDEGIIPATERALSVEEASAAVDELARAPQESSPVEEASTVQEAPSAVEDVSIVIDETPLVTEETTPAVEQADSTETFADSFREAHDEGLQEAEVDQIALANEAAETIDEAAPPAKESEDALTPPRPHLQPLVTVPSPSVKPSNGHLSPVSDEDEAVVLKSSKGEEKSTESTQPEYLTPEPTKTPGHEEPSSPMERPPYNADPIADLALEDGASKIDLGPTVAASRSPQIVVSRAEVAQDEELVPALSLDESATKDIEGPEQFEAAKDVDAPQGPGEASGNIEPSKDAQAPEAPPCQQTLEAAAETPTPEESVKPREIQEGPRSGAVAGSSGAEASQSSSLTKRTVARPSSADRTGTPNPITDSHREAAKDGNWFSAFFRLIFIDLFGGLMSRLCGGKRKTIVTTVVALAAVGLVLYQRAKDLGE